MALLLSPAHGLTPYNTGAGIVYKLEVTQDVTLESASSNYNWLQYLLVSKHPQYPNKRSLVQFENLPSDCPSDKIQGAKMYLYFVYAHKASWHTIQQTPFIPRHMEVHILYVEHHLFFIVQNFFAKRRFRFLTNTKLHNLRECYPHVLECCYSVCQTRYLRLKAMALELFDPPTQFYSKL